METFPHVTITTTNQSACLQPTNQPFSLVVESLLDGNTYIEMFINLGCDKNRSVPLNHEVLRAPKRRQIPGTFREPTIKSHILKIHLTSCDLI